MRRHVLLLAAASAQLATRYVSFDVDGKGVDAAQARFELPDETGDPATCFARSLEPGFPNASCAEVKASCFAFKHDMLDAVRHQRSLRLEAGRRSFDDAPSTRVGERLRLEGALSTTLPRRASRSRKPSRPRASPAVR